MCIRDSIHAEAYAAGELKHGTIALISEGVPVIAVATQSLSLIHILARPASIKAGLPIEVPAIAINVVCGSGLKCVNDAATMIKAGEADIVVAGGMELSLIHI